MVKIINGKEVNVTHIMKNGEVRDSLEGYEITINDLPELTVRLIREIMNN